MISAVRKVLCLSQTVHSLPLIIVYHLPFTAVKGKTKQRLMVRILTALLQILFEKNNRLFTVCINFTNNVETLVNDYETPCFSGLFVVFSKYIDISIVKNSSQIINTTSSLYKMSSLTNFCWLNKQ